MNKAQAEAFANQKMQELGLYPKWKFGWNNSKRALGLCVFNGWIYLSNFFFDELSDREVRDVILHEIAHALDFEARGTTDHGPKWKAQAVRIGAKPKRCAELADDTHKKLAKQSKYTLVCPNGHEFPSHRKRARLVSCSKCCPNYYNPQYVLRQIKNY